MRRAPSVRRPLVLSVVAVLTGLTGLAVVPTASAATVAAGRARPLVHHVQEHGRGHVRDHGGHHARSAPVVRPRPVTLRPTSTLATGPVQQVCGPASPGHATCFAARVAAVAGTGGPLLRVVDRPPASLGAPTSLEAPVPGRSPADIQSAYGLAGLSAAGRTVAIVDAYGYPNAERDLAVYRAHFGLAPCTTANGCLRTIGQTGSTTGLPGFDPGWAGEQALDLDAVSAACPSCRILLVQADSDTFADLGAAVDTAAAQRGVVAISNSYGGGDAPDDPYGAPYHHPGIAVTASTGDDGWRGASFPASSQWVIAVGGTSLYPAGNARGWTETVWGGTGSGCSTLNAAPTGQSSSVTGCSGRAMADVAALADPDTGLAVYAPDTSTSSSWGQYGGTSLSSPLVAAAFALSGNTAGEAATIPYAHPSAFNDVTSGSNGSCSSFCRARVGWDGPTGLGTPHGVSGL